ncbi:energy transducer TonB family protein [Sphingosinicella soli]|uniref:Protein TonB n=1 Tax=Sphingosinicella soli TaxID=333708 RepID=A0A7W7F7X5_9SPHN|nr:TonB family protein [Sphingosinicella soli]MBB4633139.1 protein TonB [Sphingosinicella soli]
MEGWPHKIAIAAVLAFGFGGAAQASDWKSTVTRLIAAQHSYPRSAQVRGDEGTARVRISVDAGGKITGVELVEPTASQILNREAMRIPQKIGTVPPPPGGPTKLVIPIVWKLT